MIQKSFSVHETQTFSQTVPKKTKRLLTLRVILNEFRVDINVNE